MPEQEFAVDRPNKVRVSDIIYVRTSEGWLYLTIVLDLFHRKIVGWSMSNRMHSTVTAQNALEHACKREHLSKGLIFHSDQGIQYACDKKRKHSFLGNKSLEHFLKE